MYTEPFYVSNWPNPELFVRGFTADNDVTLLLDSSPLPLGTSNDFSSLAGPTPMMTVTPGLHVFTAKVVNAGSISSITGLLVVGEVCPAVTPLPQGCAPLNSTGLVAWWRAEGDVTDTLGNHDGTWMNGATAAANGVFGVGVIGSAFDFNGVNQYISVPDNPMLHVQTVTVDGWVKTPIASIAVYNWYTPILATGDPNSHQGYELFIQRDYANSNLAHAGFIVWSSSSVGGLIGSNTVGLNVADGAWHHLAGIYDGSTVSVYVDGKLEGSKPYSGTIQYANPSPLYIGTEPDYLSHPSASHPPFQGAMDDIEVWNRSLSAGEVMAIYSSGTAGKCLTINGNPTTSVLEFPAIWVILMIGTALSLAILRTSPRKRNTSDF